MTPYVLGLSDKVVMRTVISSSFTITLLSVMTEFVTKTLSGTGHVGHAKLFVYLGLEVRFIHDTPWFIYANLASLVVYALLVLIYKFGNIR